MGVQALADMSDVERKLALSVNDVQVISVEIVEAARDSLVIGQA
jgi:hypothetical protein